MTRTKLHIGLHAWLAVVLCAASARAQSAPESARAQSAPASARAQSAPASEAPAAATPAAATPAATPEAANAAAAHEAPASAQSAVGGAAGAPTQVVPEADAPTPTVPAENGAAPAPRATGPGASGPALARPQLGGGFTSEDELAQLEAERRQLSLGMPIALSIAGAVTLATGASVLLLGVLMNSTCEQPTLDRDYHYTCDGSKDGDSAIVIGAVASVVGGVLGAVGLVQLIDRAGERRELGRRIKELRRQRDLQYGFSIERGRAQGMVRLRF